MKTSTKWVGGAILMAFMATNYGIAYSERGGDTFDLVATFIFGVLLIGCCGKYTESKKVEEQVEDRGKGPYKCPFCHDVQIEIKDFCPNCRVWIGAGWSASTHQCPFCNAIQPTNKDYCLNCDKHKVTGEVGTEKMYQCPFCMDVRAGHNGYDFCPNCGKQRP